MAKELSKIYEPKEVEKRIYEMWEKGGAFKGVRDPEKKPFTIVMPPPNVTGSSTWVTLWMRLAGHLDSLQAHEGLCRVMGSRNRPCGNSNSD